MTPPMVHNSTTKHPALLALVLLLMVSVPVKAQETTAFDSLMADYALLDSLLLAEIENDSSSLLSILEDIINETYLKSQLAVRFGYTSDITNAGRNFGIQQYGLNAGVAYYHKSGFYADLAGFYNSDQDPRYNATIAGLGYMGTFGTKWHYYLSYDHFFYNQKTASDTTFAGTYPLTNSLNSSFYFNPKKLNAGIDYSFLFGEETAHRLRLNLGYSFATGKLGFINRVSFNPNLSMLAGNANVTTLVFSKEIAMDNRRDLIRQIGFRRYRYLLQNDPEQLKLLLSEEQTTNAFGLMNYAIFMPVSINIKKSALLLTYTLNFPVALPGEENLDTAPNSFFSATFIYTFSL